MGRKTPEIRVKRIIYEIKLLTEKAKIPPTDPVEKEEGSRNVEAIYRHYRREHLARMDGKEKGSFFARLCCWHLPLGLRRNLERFLIRVGPT